MTSTVELPTRIADLEELEELLSQPSPALAAELAGLDGDVLVLGVGGKVGPTLARMAKRAAPDKRVIGVARFSQPGLRERLESWGVESHTCDLTDRQQVADLPAVRNVVYMAGRKFGTAGTEPLTWAMNAVVPTFVAERFHASRIVAFSTLCVYPFAAVDGPGHDESVAPTPVGEYPNSCVARERVFQYFSQRHGTPGRLCRLNYAIDLRYGVLHDVARRVLAGEAIDLRTGRANVIWQGDSTDHILRCLAHCTSPSTPLNIGAAAPASIRDVAERFGAIFGRAPIFIGSQEIRAWHNDCSQALVLFGQPRVDLETMIRWNADWLQREQPVYDKPTHFEQRTGSF